MVANNPGSMWSEQEVEEEFEDDLQRLERLTLRLWEDISQLRKCVFSLQITSVLLLIIVLASYLVTF